MQSILGTVGFWEVRYLYLRYTHQIDAFDVSLQIGTGLCATLCNTTTIQFEEFEHF